MIEVDEKQHAILSPSGWQTWGNCPGSVPLAEGIHVPASSYAKEGTAAHALLERCLNEHADAETFIGETYTVEGEVFTVDQEMADAINSSMDIIAGYLDNSAVLQTEQVVPLAFMTGEENAEGTCDNAIICEGGKHLVIIDFKYGKGVMVYASDFLPSPEVGKRPNGQLAMYALGWLQKNGLIYDEIEKVTLVVLQPRLEHVDEYTLPIDQLREFETVVREAAGAVEMERLAQQSGDDLTLVVGDKQCKFCNAKGICPALKSHVSTSLATIAEPSKVEHFEDLTLPKQAAAVQVDPDVSSEKLAEFGRAIDLIEEAIKAARAEIERRLFAGLEVPGFYLGVGRKGPRSWTNKDVALKELTKSGRLSMADATEKVPISPTAAEKLLKARPKIWASLQPFIDRSEGKAKVCREGVDKNPPYQIASAVEDFGDVDAPKITTSKSTVEGSGLFVEASDGSHVVIPSKDCRGPIMKLTHVGKPMAALLAALPQPIDPQLDAVGEDADAAMAALMD
jgi:hypothetical protein